MKNLKFFAIFVILGCFSTANAVYIPDSLDRGHKLILKHGFQIRALMFPYSYDGPTQYTLSLDRWAESKFNTPDIHERPAPEFFGTAPGVPWSRWMSWIHCTNSSGPYLQTHELPYLSNLVSLQAGDELRLDDPSVVNTMKQTFTIWKTNYPTVIATTTQHGLVEYDDTTLQNYQAIAQPDMAYMFAYEFRDGEGMKGGSQPKWYKALGRFRKLGMGGTNNTGITPIPYGCYYHCYIDKSGGDRNLGETEISVGQFAPLVFGYKFISAFLYNDNNPGNDNSYPQLFDGPGDTQPNYKFYRSMTNNI